jgi:hypothetical protein
VLSRRSRELSRVLRSLKQLPALLRGVRLYVHRLRDGVNHPNSPASTTRPNSGEVNLESENVNPSLYSLGAQIREIPQMAKTNFENSSMRGGGGRFWGEPTTKNFCLQVLLAKSIHTINHSEYMKNHIFVFKHTYSSTLVFKLYISFS